ncbi:MAG: NAD-dependent deacylase [Deferribacteraceae bacterium]|jgi:NAD-dependent deacetylase|nr:NAD-dependent deacylase [Deferribacteraceae bacterium]
MYKNIVILTGAGISVESGIAAFRGGGGLWGDYKVDDVATLNGYRKNPALVHDFYNKRRRELKDVSPNPAHIALAELEKSYSGRVTVITQNVDDLHERAGTKNLLHMHGELLSIRCEDCGDRFKSDEEFSIESICPACGKKGVLRPDIVWFGEVPMHLEKIEPLLLSADLFISIGTSGNVYPAAGFVRIARNNARTVEINLEASLTADLFHEHIIGNAGAVVVEYVQKLLKGGV